VTDATYLPDDGEPEPGPPVAVVDEPEPGPPAPPSESPRLAYTAAEQVLGSLLRRRLARP